MKGEIDMNIKKIICAVLALLLILIPNIAFAASNSNDVIKFADSTIEKETRRILNKESGDITKEEVLGITFFGKDPDNGLFGSNITTLSDLKWFENLVNLYLSNCKIKSLDGIESLTKLQMLDISNNNLSNINAVRNLKKLVYLFCSRNSKLTDLSPIKNLVNLETLDISNTGIANLSPLKNLKNLNFLYASNSNITNISVLSNLKNLAVLELSGNKISNVSPLKDLDKIISLNLSNNNISDIMPIQKFSRMGIDLTQNPISEDMLNKFYAPKESDYFTKTFSEKINDNNPVFTFDLLAYYNYNPSKLGYNVDSITITDTSSGKVIQKISIPELTTNGYTVYPGDPTNSSGHDPGDLGFELIDVNFDGYKDIRLVESGTYFDNYYYTIYRNKWIYLLWNQSKGIFELDKKFSDIPNAEFDEKNKLIYGKIDSPVNGYYTTTYKYINDSFVPVQYYSKVYIGFTSDIVQKYLEMFSIEESLGNGNGYREIIYDKDYETSETKVVSDDFVFYSYDAGDYLRQNPKEFARFDANSEVGKLLEYIRFYEYS